MFVGFKIYIKSLSYLSGILCLQFSITKCTIDISISEFKYISNHLTPKECRRLIASLHFVSFDLPEAVVDAEESIPKDISCIKLLIKWNSGNKKWEGKGKSYVDVAHRLRQIGRPDLADWIGLTVFHKLAKDVNSTLLNAAFINKNNEKPAAHRKLAESIKPQNEDEWTMYDSILWATLVILIMTIVFTVCRILHLNCKRAEIKKRSDQEEIMDLLRHGSMESDQETIYEYHRDTDFFLCENHNDNGTNEKENLENSMQK